MGPGCRKASDTQGQEFTAISPPCPGLPKGREEEGKEEDDEEEVTTAVTRNSNQKGKAKGRGKKVRAQRGQAREPSGSGGRSWTWGPRVRGLVGWGLGFTRG